MEKVLLFGSDYMANEYLKVLKNLGEEVVVIARDSHKTKSLALKYGYEGYGGSLSYLKNLNKNDFKLVIIATSVQSLKDITLGCLAQGFENILIEKPGSINSLELQEIRKKIDNQFVRFAYNRRYYPSVLHLKNLLLKEKLQGLFFDFSEREKDILGSGKSDKVIQRWGFANSSHVIDTSFFLIGIPVEMYSQKRGYLSFHKSGSIFTGAGKTKETDFSYYSSWCSGGRWRIEISTDRGKYSLSPLEELHFCRKDQFAWEKIEIELGKSKLKLGLKQMVNEMINSKSSSLPDIKEVLELSRVTDKIFGY
ncbi:MAG: hypothetical protein BEU03_01055 [Marine Group III euryarchaeote CG-Epi6]|uniref:Gfo/Idh/MocA-like oxidoreductase N-terminal domain-containing protein n=1 Tax=Marine Group III euryarchaeote CG-Epi6 TaxID=1889000 RepID=A0A1J5SQF6_9ARCH|nr:MAG: hypothetical protein BEU03_01055 [Marine Group III euryarchaeote CG-Epi6]